MDRDGLVFGFLHAEKKYRIFRPQWLSLIHVKKSTRPTHTHTHRRHVWNESVSKTSSKSPYGNAQFSRRSEMHFMRCVPLVSCLSACLPVTQNENCPGLTTRTVSLHMTTWHGNRVQRSTSHKKRANELQTVSLMCCGLHYRLRSQQIFSKSSRIAQLLKIHSCVSKRCDLWLLSVVAVIRSRGPCDGAKPNQMVKKRKKMHNARAQRSIEPQSLQERVKHWANPFGGRWSELAVAVKNDIARYSLAIGHVHESSSADAHAPRRVRFDPAVSSSLQLVVRRLHRTPIATIEHTHANMHSAINSNPHLIARNSH